MGILCFLSADSFSSTLLVRLEEESGGDGDSDFFQKFGKEGKNLLSDQFKRSTYRVEQLGSVSQGCQSKGVCSGGQSGRLAGVQPVGSGRLSGQGSGRVSGRGSAQGKGGPEGSAWSVSCYTSANGFPFP